jgi:hypothetical protein
MWIWDLDLVREKQFSNQTNEHLSIFRSWHRCCEKKASQFVSRSIPQYGFETSVVKQDKPEQRDGKRRPAFQICPDRSTRSSADRVPDSVAFSHFEIESIQSIHENICTLQMYVCEFCFVNELHCERQSVRMDTQYWTRKMG